MIKDYTKGNGIYTYTDMFGVGFNFLLDGSSKIRTGLGTLLTLFYICIIFSLFFAFGIDLYERKNPKISFNTQIENYKLVNVSNSNFIFAFRIEDQMSHIVQRDDMFSFEIIYFLYQMNQNGVWEIAKEQVLSQKKCYDFPDIKQKEIYYNVSLAEWYCIDFNNTQIGGNWDGSFVAGFLIDTKQCIGKTCLNFQELEKQFDNNYTSSNYFFSYLYMESLPMMDNYNNPLKSTLVNHYEMLNLQVTKRNIQVFKKVEINDDRGWLFSGLEQQSTFASDSLSSDFTFKDPQRQDILFSYFLYLGRKLDGYNRSYTKVQQVFAAIGGFSRLFYSVLFFFYYSIGLTLKFIKLMNIIDFEEEESEGGRNLEKKEVKSPIKLLQIPKINFQYHQERISTKTVNLHLSKSDNTPARSPQVTFYSYVLYKCTCVKKNKVKKSYVENFEAYRSYFEKCFDITTYLRLLHQFKHIKKLILNENQVQLIDQSKPNYQEKSINYPSNFIQNNQIKQTSGFVKYDYTSNLDFTTNKHLVESTLKRGIQNLIKEN